MSIIISAATAFCQIQ